MLGAAANRHTPGVERPDLIVVILRRRFASYQDKTTTIGGQSISVIYTDSIHTFIGPSSRTTQVSQYQKGKTNQETVSGSVISLAICKSAPRCRQITTPAPHLSVLTGRMPFLPPNQQSQSTEGIICRQEVVNKMAGLSNLADLLLLGTKLLVGIVNSPTAQ